jgi:hypothetical protein
MVLKLIVLGIFPSQLQKQNKMSNKNFELCNCSWELNYHVRKGILIPECVKVKKGKAVLVKGRGCQ